jgi:hypothetical protein
LAAARRIGYDLTMRRRRNAAAWLGLALGLIGVVGYFVWISLRIGPRVPFLRDTAIVNLIILGAGLGFSVVGIRRAFGLNATHRGRVLAPLLGAINLTLGALFILMLFRASVLPDAVNAPAVAQTAPDFTLSDQTGAPVHLAGLRGKNVLLVFYRGHW